MSEDAVAPEDAKENSDVVETTLSGDKKPGKEPAAETACAPAVPYAGVPTPSGHFPYYTHPVSYYATSTVGGSGTETAHPFAYAHPPPMNYGAMMNPVYMYAQNALMYHPAASMMYGMANAYGSVQDVPKEAVEHGVSRQKPSSTAALHQSSGRRSATGKQSKKEVLLRKRTLPALDSEEEVMRWIEERRKRYPTLARIVEKAKQEEAEGRATTTTTASVAGEAEEGVPSSRDMGGETRPKSRRVCKYHRRGQCRNGVRCKFLHDQGNKRDDRTEGLAALLQDAQQAGRREATLLEILAFLKARNFRMCASS